MVPFFFRWIGKKFYVLRLLTYFSYVACTKRWTRHAWSRSLTLPKAGDCAYHSIYTKRWTRQNPIFVPKGERGTGTRGTLLGVWLYHNKELYYHYAWVRSFIWYIWFNSICCTKKWTRHAWGRSLTLLGVRLYYSIHTKKWTRHAWVWMGGSRISWFEVLLRFLRIVFVSRTLCSIQLVQHKFEKWELLQGKL